MDAPLPPSSAGKDDFIGRPEAALRQRIREALLDATREDVVRAGEGVAAAVAYDAVVGAERKVGGGVGWFGGWG
jgi:hypothetical protein